MKKEKTMSNQFVEIDQETLERLEKVAKANGYSSVEKLLTAFALQFSTGCSVTLQPTKAVA